MAAELAPGGSSLIDLLERVLDRGIVVGYWAGDSRKIDRFVIIERVITVTHENATRASKFGSAASSQSALPATEDDESGPSGSDSEG